MVTQATRMYDELSPETGVFFRFMVENELMDLVAKTGKRPGGYCTPIPGEKSMFIFSNFNGTAGDVVVLTHEAGHAFMMYEARENTVPEYGIPTFELVEDANLISPFEDGCMESIVEDIKAWFASLDDSKF